MYCLRRRALARVLYEVLLAVLNTAPLQNAPVRRGVLLSVRQNISAGGRRFSPKQY